MRRYCLSCFETLSSDRCSVCGTPDRAALRARFWNDNPGIRRLKRRLDLALLIAATVGLALAFTVVGPPPSSSMTGMRASGFAYLLPLVYYAAGRLSTSTLSRERTDVRPSLLWTVSGGILVLSSTVLLAPLGILAGFAVLLVSKAVSGRFRIWKERLQREGDPALRRSALDEGR